MRQHRRSIGIEASSSTKHLVAGARPPARIEAGRRPRQQQIGQLGREWTEWSTVVAYAP